MVSNFILASALDKVLSMKRLLALSVAALAGLTLFCSEDAFAQKKDKKGAAKSTQYPAEAKDYAALQSAKELVGTVQGTDAKSITLRIDIPHYEKNPNYKPPANNGNNTAANQIQQHMNRIAQIQQQLATSKTAQQRNQHMQQLNQEKNALNQAMARMQQQQAKAAGNNNNPNSQPFKVVSDHKDFDLDFTEKVVIRKMFLETGYDDKGNLIEYTKDKIAKLKGDNPNLPGYTAKFDDIQPGMVAKLMLVAPKTMAKSKDAKDDDNLVGAVDRPTVRMVILMAEKANGPTATPNAKGK
jgi:hypothetical protein